MVMNDIDLFASTLFEEAKRFLEKASEADSDDGKAAFLHAALLLGISSLEAHINAISDEMIQRGNLSVLHQSVLSERDYAFDKGAFKLTNKLKMYNLIDRVEFLFKQFSIHESKLDNRADWWSKLHQGIDKRNSLVHPKSAAPLEFHDVEHAFEGILGVLDALYQSVYGKSFPALGRRFDSKMSF